MEIGTENLVSGTSAISSSKIKMDYMKLLVAQFQNQNPLEPLNNNEMASQLAQLAQLEQSEQMNLKLGSIESSFAGVLAASNRSYAGTLLGKNVTFYVENKDTGDMATTKGLVNSVVNGSREDGNLLGVTVGTGDGAKEYTISLGAIVLIEN